MTCKPAFDDDRRHLKGLKIRHGQKCLLEANFLDAVSTLSLHSPKAVPIEMVSIMPMKAMKKIPGPIFYNDIIGTRSLVAQKI